MDTEYIVAIIVAIATILFGWKLLTRPSNTNANARTSTTPKAKVASSNMSSPNGDSEQKIAMNIYFGSQSGTAETFSLELAEQAKQNGFVAKVIDLEDFDEDDLPSDRFAVFLVATFGEGEPTDNAAKFYEWIKSKEREPGCCNAMNFAVFALGNRQYEHYCYIGRQVDEKLAQLGGRRIMEVGEGDDDGTLEDDFADWKTRFWPQARAHFGMSASTTADGTPVEEFKSTIGCTFFAIPKPGDKQKAQDDLYSLELGDDNKSVASSSSVNSNDDTKLAPAPLYVGGLVAFQRYSDPKHKADTILCTSNRELRQDSSSTASTRHLEFSLPKGCRLKYTTSYNLGIFARNDFKLAARMARRLGVDTRSLFKMEKKPGNRKLPLPMQVCSIQDALLWYLDFMHITRSKTLKILAMYANGDDKAKLLHWANEGKEEFHALSMNLLEVLEAVPSVTPPWSEFVEWCPKLQPRFYTIASSSKQHSDSIHLTVALTVDELPGGRTHLGVCSSYLAGLRPDKDQICAFVRKSSFELPRAANTPIIMIGPGTGVAPFRGFWQEIRWLRRDAEKKEAEKAARAAEGKTEEKSMSVAAKAAKEPYRVGEATLYFGCRRKDQDWIYNDEMEEYSKDTCINVVTAFSRAAEQKVYVQDRMLENSKQLWAALQAGAYIYVCGGTAMGRSVRQAITTIVEREGGMSAERAHAYVEQLQKAAPQQRYVQELWS